VTFTFDPPTLLLYIVIFILIANVGVMAFGRRHPVRKILGLIVSAVIVTILLVRYHTIGTRSLTTDDAGVAGTIEGMPTIPWSAVTKAVYVADVGASEYRPGRPDDTFAMLGTVDARYGWFRLADGDHALVALEHMHGGGVMIATSDAVYLLGPSNVGAFAKPIAEHVPLSEQSAAIR
jgi:hypothetical protein